MDCLQRQVTALCSRLHHSGVAACGLAQRAAILVEHTRAVVRQGLLTMPADAAASGGEHDVVLQG